MFIKKYIEFMREAKEKPGNLYRYGCVMIELNILNWDELTDRIDPEDLYEPENPAHGLETNPHATLLYPVDPEVKFVDIKNILDSTSHDKMEIEINGIGCFENTEFDVIKLNIIPIGFIENIHNELKKLPNLDKYPTYEPHITLAFLKKGTGKKYINSNYKYTIKNIGRIKYTKPTGEKFYYDI